MTMRKRMLAVLRGRKHDRVPFVQYDNCAARTRDIWDLVGRENMGILKWTSLHRFEFPLCRFETKDIEKDGRKGVVTTIHTPKGSLVQERLIEPAYGSSHITRHFVRTREDYIIFMEYLKDCVVLENTAQFLEDDKWAGSDGLPLVSVGRTPYQQLWIEWTGLESLCMHLSDFPDVVQECVDMLAGQLRQVFGIVRAAAEKVPLPFVDIIDNITAPAIGPRFFDKYCVPLYRELASMLSESKTLVVAHLDGNLKPLKDGIAGSGIGGIDSFTPVPVGDTTAAEALQMWPRMKLLLNFPSSVHLSKPAEVYAHAMKILEEAGHSGSLQIQISENVPADCWRTSIPEIVRAIKDFGTP
ncbi:hypothetical protein COY52_05130 [Candidatus Desantisbacteria bacterium CG_4_10_14_0_8_um_filter_48_22]|uniref:Uroporphyrinogen decarboxylase (URO-D) domain-containing protein n=1 Tax=Candidatus Desantisbacteria bacterium CG_4_10_14_0_8_um_filter_48_22 TaxID=1974543 RepID=A0A2M7SCE0_9BACT|nr:MAG: hypothetical protein AUJ67_02130 [Candidatus Desantisbacteria bacterium CG1_02_49_89]PIV55167.1 MAG: hypothetical protein COS16_08150 [Candidatus Desantisbacteria bacterium CG02_land_8_20_14_3_00_49_13]PIZ17139.1 MAG: hypothetical protein COY52_05130 [Candidatus Desantisbacteria bacterium CG_4_10_14_0_8_um_filter_48_22]